MKRINKEHSVFSMSEAHPPAERIYSGETIIFETYDCYTNQIKSEEQLFSTIKRELNNPATGPVYVQEAEPGDILKVEVLDIRISESGVMAVRPDAGVLGDYINEPKSKIIPIRNGQAVFNEWIQLPVHPMIGVIGVAPAGPEIKTTVPDAHGGNLDCKRIVKGSLVYLPVLVPGALLAMGDLHAVMADGEIVICGLEIDGEVTVRVSVLKGKALPLPMVIEGEQIMTLASAETLDEAAKQATIQMHGFLTRELKMSNQEAGMLLSLVGDLRICQVVDPLMTVRMEFPKNILAKYGYVIP